MKKIKYLLIITMAVMMSVSCSKDDDDDVNPIVGTWGYTETFDGEVLVFEVTFKENLTGTMMSFSQVHSYYFVLKILSPSWN